MTLRLSFHGAAGTVTGSRFLLGSGGAHVLVDCGLFQGLKELRLMNWREPSFDPRHVDAVLLTHAHVDHCGYLPRLVRDGFRGPVYCTPATAELARIVLLDAARLQEEDAAYANRKGFSKHHPALPLFTERDAEAALHRFRPVRYGHHLGLPGGLAATFHNAGHILGSAHIRVAEDSGDSAALVFSGDLGRTDMPLHVDPEPRPPCDAVVLDSTYGDRVHTSRSLEDQLRGPFEAAVRRKGVVLIPAFAVARTQLLALMLKELMDERRLPRMPIHIDSPMAAEVTAVYSRHLRSGELDPDVGDLRRLQLFPEAVHFHHTIEESRRLNDLPGPRVIIASAGMLTGGRVLHHLARLAPNDDNLIVLAGFQAAGTRGRRLLDGERTIRVHGQDVPINCHLISVEGLSAHADATELVQWAGGDPAPASVFVAHGEPAASAALAKRLEAAGMHAIVPRMDDAFEFVAASRRWRSVANSR